MSTAAPPSPCAPSARSARSCQAAAFSRPVLASVLAASCRWRTSTARCSTISGGSTSTACSGLCTEIVPGREGAHRQRRELEDDLVTPAQHLAERRVRRAEHDHADDEARVDGRVGQQRDDDGGQAGAGAERGGAAADVGRPHALAAWTASTTVQVVKAQRYSGCRVGRQTRASRCR